MSDDIERHASEPIELDRARVEGIVEGIMLPVRANYLRGPRSRDRVLEALNALACGVALDISGCGDGDEAEAWFQQVLAQQLDSLSQQLAERSAEPPE